MHPNRTTTTFTLPSSQARRVNTVILRYRKFLAICVSVGITSIEMEASKRHEMKTVPELSNELGAGLKIRHNFRGELRKSVCRCPTFLDSSLHVTAFSEIAAPVRRASDNANQNAKPSDRTNTPKPTNATPIPDKPTASSIPKLPELEVAEQESH